MRSKDKSPKKRNTKVVAYVVNNMKTTCPLTTFKQMRHLQNSTGCLIPKMPFCLVVREILMQYGDFRVQSLALQALQEAAEKYLVDIYSDAGRCCAHAKRVTLFPRDIRLVLDIRGVRDPGFQS